MFPRVKLASLPGDHSDSDLSLPLPLDRTNPLPTFHLKVMLLEGQKDRKQMTQMLMPGCLQGSSIRVNKSTGVLSSYKMLSLS